MSPRVYVCDVRVRAVRIRIVITFDTVGNYFIYIRAVSAVPDTNNNSGPESRGISYRQLNGPFPCV